MDILRECGYSVAVVEKWNRFGRGGRGVRQDLFGVIDVIGVGVDGTVAVQCCGADVAAHVRKVRECDYLPAMLAAGWNVAVYSWTVKDFGTDLSIVEITEPAPALIT